MPSLDGQPPANDTEVEAALTARVAQLATSATSVLADQLSQFSSIGAIGASTLVKDMAIETGLLAQLDQFDRWASVSSIFDENVAQLATSATSVLADQLSQFSSIGAIGASTLVKDMAIETGLLAQLDQFDRWASVSSIFDENVAQLATSATSVLADQLSQFSSIGAIGASTLVKDMAIETGLLAQLDQFDRWASVSSIFDENVAQLASVAQPVWASSVMEEVGPFGVAETLPRPPSIRNEMRAGARPTRVREPRRSAALEIAPDSGRLVDVVEWVHVRSTWEVALETLAMDPAGAIRAARTTLESVCKHICDERAQPYGPGGDLIDLYRSVQRCLPLAPKGGSDRHAKQLLGGLSSLLSGVAALRNELSDAHGKGKDSPTPRPQDARLVVNTAFAVMQFLIECHLAADSNI